MAKTKEAPGIDAESLAMLDGDVKKGKPRKFVLIYKGATIKTLICFKKGQCNTKIQAAKKLGHRGDTVCGLVIGSGVNLTFQLPGSKDVAKVMGVDGSVDKEPTKTTKIKEFLAENNLKRKPVYEIVNDPAQVKPAPADEEEGEAVAAKPKVTAEEKAQAREKFADIEQKLRRMAADLGINV